MLIGSAAPGVVSTTRGTGKPKMRRSAGAGVPDGCSVARIPAGMSQKPTHTGSWPTPPVASLGLKARSTSAGQEAGAGPTGVEGPPAGVGYWKARGAGAALAG